MASRQGSEGGAGDGGRAADLEPRPGEVFLHPVVLGLLGAELLALAVLFWAFYTDQDPFWPFVVLFLVVAAAGGVAVMVRALAVRRALAEGRAP